MTAEKTERNYGVDLLRILAMYFVVVLHVMGGGGILKAGEFEPATREAAWLLESFAIVAVNCFALISGYVGLRAKHGFTGFALLYLQVYTYSTLIMLLCRGFRPEWVDFSVIRRALLPVGYKQYWYFTAYVGLFFFMPALNAAAEHLRRAQFLTSAAGILVLYGVYRSLIQQDMFAAKNGYSALWLIVLYYLGAGIRRHIPLTKKVIPAAIAVYIAASVLGWLEAEGPDRFVRLRYDGSPTLIASLALFAAFAALPVKRQLLRRVIGFVSPLTFAVYLIHTHPLIYNNILTKRFERWAQYSPQHMLCNVVLTAAGIFFACIAAECLRTWLVKRLRIRDILNMLEARLKREAAELNKKTHTGKGI